MRGSEEGEGGKQLMRKTRRVVSGPSSRVGSCCMSHGGGSWHSGARSEISGASNHDTCGGEGVGMYVIQMDGWMDAHAERHGSWELAL